MSGEDDAVVDVGPSIGPQPSDDEVCAAYCSKVVECLDEDYALCIELCEIVVSYDATAAERFWCASHLNCMDDNHCGGPPKTPADDSCIWAEMDVCLEPLICAPGTSATACGAGHQPDPDPGPPSASCETACSVLDSCFNFSGIEIVMEDCAKRCKGNVYNRAVYQEDLECYAAATTCDDVVECAHDIARCGEVCDAMMACGRFEEEGRQVCMNFCGTHVTAGALSEPQVLCLIRESCEKMGTICLDGRDHLYAECGLFPADTCRRQCSCAMAWKPCDPKVPCYQCMRACMKIVSCRDGQYADMINVHNCMVGCEANWTTSNIECFKALPAENMQGRNCNMANIVACM